MNRILLAMLVLVACTAISPWERTLCAALGQDGVEEAGNALRNKANFPWYDDTNDELTKPRFRSESESTASHRDSDWVNEESKTQTNRGRKSSGSFWTRLLSIIPIILLVILFAALVAFLVWAFMRQETSIHKDDVEDWLEETRTDEQRIEDLPFEVQAPKSDLLAAARAAFQQGDRAKGLVYLYSYMLVRLDRAHLLRLAKGKTNRQYLGEIRSYESLSGLVERTMVSFERVFFGHHNLEQDEADACWNSLDEFHRLVEASET